MKKYFISLSFVYSNLFASNITSYGVDELFDLSLEQLMQIKITTASKYFQDQKDSPVNIFLFTQQTIKERGYENVLDILESLPSVDVNHISSSFGKDDISIRGAAGNNKFLILLNGVRISSPSGEITPIGHNYPIYHAKQVEVLLGAAGVTYGADAYAGVVNIITNDKSNGGELYISTARDGYFNSYANGSYQFDDFELNTMITGYRDRQNDLSSLYRDEYQIPAPANVQNGYNFSATKDITFFTNIKSKNFEAGINHYEHDHSLNYIFKPIGSSFDEDSVFSNRLTNVYSKAVFDISKDFLSQTTLSYARSELDNGTYFKNIFVGFNQAYKYSLTNNYSILQDFSLELDSHHLSFGASFDYFDIIPRSADLESAYNTSKSSTNQNLNYFGTSTPVNFHQYNYKNYGFYIQDDYRFNTSLHFVIGMRYDINTLYDNSFNPRASIIYRPNQDNVIKLIYSSAFLAPPSDKIYNEYGDITQQNVGYSFRHMSNPDLQPERLRTIELNYEYFFNKNRYIKFAPYYTAIKDMIAEQSAYSSSGGTTYETVYFDNVAKSTIVGADVTFNDVSSVGRLEFKSWVNLSYTDAKVKEAQGEKDMPQVAKYKAKLGSTIIYDSKLYVTPKIRYIGKTPLAEDTKSADAYSLVDLNLQYKVTKDLSLVSNVYNLFDKRYMNATSSFENSVFQGESPQPSRLVTIGVCYKF